MTKKNLVPPITELHTIKRIAAEKEVENDHFKVFLKQQNSEQVDTIVHQLNETITPQIDCTQCGNCCKSLMINVTPQETALLAEHLKMDIAVVKEKYIEVSEQGQMIVNTIPCHFLKDTSCTIYQNRFTECREFPHLHKANFKARFFSTIQYYSMCPIIFNVTETLKDKLGFKV